MCVADGRVALRDDAAPRSGGSGRHHKMPGPPPLPRAHTFVFRRAHPRWRAPLEASHTLRISLSHLRCCPSLLPPFVLFCAFAPPYSSTHTRTLPPPLRVSCISASARVPSPRAVLVARAAMMPFGSLCACVYVDVMSARAANQSDSFETGRNRQRDHLLSAAQKKLQQNKTTKTIHLPRRRRCIVPAIHNTLGVAPLSSL